MPERNGRDRCASRKAALKDVVQLQQNRGLRNRRGVFFVEGVRNFVRALDAGFTIERIVFSEKLLINPLARKLVRQCRRAGCETLNVSPEEFRSVSKTQRASGVCAVLRQRWSPLSEISPTRNMCWFLLETVQSAGNLGTLIRSSNAAGGAGFILLGQKIDPYAPSVIRSAMGAIFEQAFVRTDFDSLQSWIKAHGCSVVGATPAANDDLHRFRHPERPLLLVLGEERNGLSKQQKSLCTYFVRIPMQEGVDSLNLGVAGSLLIYEVHRSQNAGASP